MWSRAPASVSSSSCPASPSRSRLVRRARGTRRVSGHRPHILLISRDRIEDAPDPRHNSPRSAEMPARGRRDGQDSESMPGGRDQREPMERLVRLATALHHAGRVGVPAEKLFEVAGFDGADPVTQLNREFKHLRALGWEITNIGATGESGRYRMVNVDNRLRVALTPAQQAALRRAVLVADRADLVERLGLAPADKPDEVPTVLGRTVSTEGLSTVVDAVRRARLLRFDYKGKPRVVHPQSLRVQSTTWYLRGREDGRRHDQGVRRLSDAARHRRTLPTPPPAPRWPPHQSIHPMSWEVDPPVEVTLRAPDEHVADVRRWLGVPQEERPGDGTTELVYRVTNRAALRSRIYLLGRRVSVVGPEDVRAELIAELAQMAGE